MSNPLLSADTPKTNPQDDQLGFARFAQHLASSICNMPSSSGFVIALNGPWGSGKSTVLNFVRYYLDNLHKSDAPLVLVYNPWTFPSRDDLTRSLLEQFLALSKTHKLAHGFQKTLARFAAAYAEAPLPYSSIAKGAASLLKEKKAELAKLKRDMAAKFAKLKRPVLVLVDDLDRLAQEEIRDLFRVIKGVADLPNVIYFLAFDRAVVAEALRSLASGSGEQYLEKIVQVPFELPEPEQRSIQTMFLNGISSIFADTPPELVDQDRWNELFLEGVQPLIRTPRHVARLLNALTLTYPAVEGEVNPADFVGMEALRVFHPAAYQSVRENISEFQGNRSSFLAEDTRKKNAAVAWEATMKLIPIGDQTAIDSLLNHLFPTAEIARNNFILVEESGSN